MSEQNTEKKSVKRKKKKNKTGYLYFYLFAFVFLSALAGFSYIVKSYSPDIDVNIGNNESLTLSEQDSELEIKSVDERLKWIQMEDEMPTVALRNSEQQDNPMNINLFPDVQEENIEQELRKKEEKNKVIPPPPVPSIKDIQAAHPDFRTVKSDISENKSVSSGPIPLPTKPQNSVVPLPSSITKVYLGSYASLDEAMAVQQEISSRDSSISPFIKATNNSYIVQLGSFSDKERAVLLVQKLRTLGYFPKIVSVN